MHNPPHPGEIIKELCIEPLGLTVTNGLHIDVKRRSVDFQIKKSFIF